MNRKRKNMKLHNKYNLPQTIADALRDQQANYHKGDAWKSITGLMAPPRIGLLSSENWSKMSEDLSDQVWKIFGSAVHNILDSGQSNSHIKEERLFMEIDGKTISGALDVQEITDYGIIVTDYKVTKTRSVMPDSFVVPGWTAQLNCYAELVEQNKNLPVTDLKICAILRDHELRRTDQQGYPPSPVHMIEIDLWSPKERREYISQRIAAHVEAEKMFASTGFLPLCTDEERWKRGDKWAVMPSAEAKRAKRVFETEEEASELADTNDKFVVEHRPATAVRCEGFCNVSDFCDQYQGELK
jgi:hypothetical protein